MLYVKGRFLFYFILFFIARGVQLDNGVHHPGNMMKRCGLSVSPCIIPMLIWIGVVAPKWLLWKEVVEFV